MIGKKAQKK